LATRAGGGEAMGRRVGGAQGKAMGRWVGGAQGRDKGCGGRRNRGRSRWDQPLGSILD
jgi:hypothetical protein